MISYIVKTNHLHIICNNFRKFYQRARKWHLWKRIRGLNQHLHMNSFPSKVHYGQRNLHLCICIAFSRQKDKNTARTCFNFKCVAVRYMIHFYCLAVEAGFYSDVVECWTSNPADRVRSPVWENVIWIFSPFLLHLVASVGWQSWSLMGEASAGLSLGA